MINVAAYARALMPGVNAWFGAAYNEFPEEWREIFDNYTSDKNFEEDVNTFGLGLAQYKPEGSSIVYDTMGQGWIKRYQNITYGLGVVCTREAIEDNQYEQLLAQKTKSLAMSAKQTRENVGANVLNRAFDTNFLQADGVTLLNTANRLSKGGTYANRPTSGEDLSEASLENALIGISNMVNDAGLRINVMGKKLIIPTALMFEAKRILGNPLRPGTADRDINAMVTMGMLPEGFVVNHYLTDENAWFIKTNCPDGLKHFERRPVEITNDTSDFDTENMKYKVTFRDSFGCTDKRGIYGSPGA